jgi:hypothetical protein
VLAGQAFSSVTGALGSSVRQSAGRREAARFDRLTELAGVDVALEGHLDFGPAAEVGPVVRAGVEAEDRRDRDERDAQRDPELPLAHEVELPTRLEELHGVFLKLRADA